MDSLYNAGRTGATLPQDVVNPLFANGLPQGGAVQGNAPQAGNGQSFSEMMARQGSQPVYSGAAPGVQASAAPMSGNASPATSSTSVNSTSSSTNPYDDFLRQQLQRQMAMYGTDNSQQQAQGVRDAQQTVADTELHKQLSRSLAANGVLPTGGLSSQYWQELSAPVYDRLNAQQAQTQLDLHNQFNQGSGQLTSTLAGIQNNRSQLDMQQAQNAAQLQFSRDEMAQRAQQAQASLSQQASLASQQLAAEQARASQANSLAQQQLDYTKLSDANKLAFQKQQSQLQYSQGQGSGSGGAGGSGGNYGYDMNLGAGMQQNYNQMNAAENLRAGRNADGTVRTNAAGQYTGNDGGAFATNLSPVTSATQGHASAAGGFSSGYSNGASGSPGGGGAAGGYHASGGSGYNGGTSGGGSGFSVPGQTSFYSAPMGGSSFEPTSSFYWS